MNKKMIILNLILILILVIMPLNTSKANGTISLTTDLQKIKKEETFNLNIKLENVSAAAMTLYIYFNTDLVEYISGPENSNYSNSRIIYTWFNENGIDKYFENSDQIQFNFKAKEEGIAAFSIFGEIYDASGDKVDVDFEMSEIEIYKEEEIITQENNIDASNSYLSQMRLNKEGINPVFDKNITQYYLITEDKINNLEVTAVPENPESNVSIKGNTNLKKGLNIIEIEVTSKDKKNKTKYVVNVTISDNLENDNANLENLAIENYYLTPTFDKDVTNYTVSVDHNTSNLNILAISENMDAKTEVKGNSDFKTGNNKVEILVTSKNGKTTKKYVIDVYKRNETEDISFEEEKKEQAEKLSAIIEEENIQENIEENNSEEKNKKINPIIIIILGLISITIIIVIIKKTSIDKGIKTL